VELDLRVVELAEASLAAPLSTALIERLLSL